MADHSFYIETPRLVLSHMVPSIDSHADFIVAMHNTPEVRAGNGGLALNLQNREDGRQNIEEDNARQRLHLKYGRYLISLKPASSEKTEETPIPERLESFQKVGIVGLKHRLGPGAPTLPDIGFSLYTGFAGKGYATEAASALVKYHQDNEIQTQFLGYCDPLNERSMGMFKRLGWQERGMWDIKGLAKNGRVVRGIVWSLGVEEDLEKIGLEKVEEENAVGVRP